MIFDFFRKIFFKADEGNRKRKADESISFGDESPKKYCYDPLVQLQPQLDSTAKPQDKYFQNENENKFPVFKSTLLDSNTNFAAPKNFNQLSPVTNRALPRRHHSHHRLTNKKQVFPSPRQKSSHNSTLNETIRISTRQQYDNLLQNYLSMNLSRAESRKNKENLFSPKMDDSQEEEEEDVEELTLSITKPKPRKSMDMAREQLCKAFGSQLSLLKASTSKNMDSTEEVEEAASHVEYKPVEVIQVNSMKEQVESKAVMKPDFLATIMKKYNDRFKQRQKEAEELEKMTSILAKQNRMVRESILENQLNYSLKLCEEILDESKLEPEPELPKLTSDMLDKVRSALSMGPPSEVLAQDFGLRITRKDMQTLSGLNWLNDEVINFYMNLLIKRGETDKFPNVYAMNTFFYPKLVSSGHSSLKRWTRKVDIFSKDLVVVPVHLGIHWCISVIDFRNKTINYFDSMGTPNPKCLQVLKQYLLDESMDKKKKPFDLSGWNFVCLKDIPQQMNGSDCGVFSCVFAEHVCANRDFKFSQDDMPYFRNKMVYEILNAQLL